MVLSVYNHQAAETPYPESNQRSGRAPACRSLPACLRGHKPPRYYPSTSRRCTLRLLVASFPMLPRAFQLRSRAPFRHAAFLTCTFTICDMTASRACSRPVFRSMRLRWSQATRIGLNLNATPISEQWIYTGGLRRITTLSLLSGGVAALGVHRSVALRNGWPL